MMSEHWKRLLPMLIFLFGFPGCFHVSGSLFPPPRPMHEVQVGGEGKDKILIVDISGIIRERSGASLGRGEASTVEWVRANLDRAGEDEKIRALILRINSPGGYVTACDIVHSEIVRFKKERNIPVVAVLMGTALSGGYYVATTADRIVAHPTTSTGSIGVIFHEVSIKGLMEKIGVEEEAISTGERKDMGSPFRGLTDQERELFEGIVQSHFLQFLRVVREGRRGIAEESIKVVSDGRILTAPESLRLGLVDQIGYLTDGIGRAKNLAGIEEARIIVYQGSPRSLRTIYTTGGAIGYGVEEGFLYF